MAGVVSTGLLPDRAAGRRSGPSAGGPDRPRPEGQAACDSTRFRPAALAR
ncbi:hypothetical protein MCBMB27_01486 [Methylobacterium phyllosphaerae]|uniref:Uncharacterized protein n=1 Tax=Methylobacterium phyllosphaerae TaxID=418223 RepID=A0AAE8HN16_9HYPH|nr:hypothetical protein MCBMB27_01486 [Methylobacterium phyllosphaerae]SFG25503.1 hypothetical protein SAMN05192567_101272 [Methylobacterium phyllosphaerae]SFU33298.1 hypothetical protein SAMN02799643_00283 [Methylobacterium sp. UNCCL125]